MRLQASGDQEGYNTDAAVEFDTKAGTWTHSIEVAEIPVIDCDGTGTGTTLCWELFVDINESNSTPRISLNKVEIYYTDSPTLTGYPFTLPGDHNTSLQYAFSDTGDAILIHDVNQGSGRGDLRYLVPLTNITIPTGCNYGNLAGCNTFFVLYSQWGAPSGTYAADGGFDEWKVKIYPIPTNIATQLRNTNGANPDTDIADEGQVAIGTEVYDTATLGGGVTSDAGGTVTYFYQNQTVAGCASGTPIGSPVTVTNGIVPASSTVVLSAAGTYEFWAVYSGDPPDNSPSTSPCGSETVIVGRNAPAPHSTPVVQIKDTFSVTGFAAPASVVPVLVGLYSDTTCTTQVGTDASFAVPASGGTVTGETNFVAVTAGTYSYKISYAGDANNTAFSSCAERVGVTITSLP